MRTPAELVDAIRAICKEQHTSLTKLEEKFAWANGTIGKWTKGAKYPPHDKLQKIAEELSVSTEYLLGTEVEDEYSAKFRRLLLSALEAHDSYEFENESIGDFLKIKHWAEISRPLSLAEACEAADFAGISLDDLIHDSDNDATDDSVEKKESPDAEKSAPGDEQEEQIMVLVRTMVPAQKDFLLALLNTVVARNQETPAFDQASAGVATPKFGPRGLTP